MYSISGKASNGGITQAHGRSTGKPRSASPSANLIASAPLSSRSRQDPDVVVVGAGPAALQAATQLKLRSPNLRLKLLEKREQCTRDNPLELKRACLDGAQEDPFGVIAKLKARLKAGQTLRINDIEHELRGLAKELEIDLAIVPEGVKDVKAEVLDAYPGARLFVGADGAHSTFRQQLYPTDNLQQTELRHAALVKYHVDGEARPLGKLQEVYPLLKANSHHLTKERVGTPEEGKTAITLQIVITPTEYKALADQGATFNNPIRLFPGDGEARSVPQKLRTDVKRFIGLRYLNRGQAAIAGDVTLSVTKTPQHRNKTVVQRRGDRYMALIGDAALGLSFYKGMNSALKCANEFAQAVSAQWSRLQACQPGQTASHDLFKAASEKVYGPTEVLPIDGYTDACVVVNNVVRSRTRLFEEDAKGHAKEVEASGTAAGESSSKAHERAKRIARTYPLHGYAEFMEDHATRKLKQGHGIDAKLNNKDKFVEISGQVPWQVLSYTSEQLEQMERASEIALRQSDAKPAQDLSGVSANRFARLLS